uniref:SCP domain-containing protein n=1 Tax=Macrostomum lignano TaxID=282301 RepID=A0A1I8J074_9PLAT
AARLPPLVFSAKLARQAQKWAEQLAIAGYLKHSPNAAGNFGENVALKMALRSRDYRGSQAAAQWYSEIEMFDFDGKENQSRCGHFSQVVWKSTRKVGFGKAVSEEDGKMFAVGHYFPPGNMLNCWVANIPQPLSGQINIPSHEDIMGADVSQSATKEFSSNQPLVDDSNPASRLLLTASQEFGDLTQFEPKPKDSQDRQKWAEQLLLDGNSLRRCESAEARSLGQSVARRPGSWTALRPAPPGLGPAAQLARQWYSEMKGFDFSRLGDETRCELNGGHFTQMVWRATKKLGVGCAVDANTGNACAVCFYHPCGNIAGQFSDNVPPPYDNGLDKGLSTPES